MAASCKLPVHTQSWCKPNSSHGSLVWPALNSTGNGGVENWLQSAPESRPALRLTCLACIESEARPSHGEARPLAACSAAAAVPQEEEQHYVLVLPSQLPFSSPTPRSVLLLSKFQPSHLLAAEGGVCVWSCCTCARAPRHAPGRIASGSFD
jgi:hypothetical protein